MGIDDELLPRVACLRERGVCYLRNGAGTRVSPKRLDSHQEENKANLARRGDGPKATMANQEGRNRDNLVKEEMAQGGKSVSLI